VRIVVRRGGDGDGKLGPGERADKGKKKMRYVVVCPTSYLFLISVSSSSLPRPTLSSLYSLDPIPVPCSCRRKLTHP